MIDRAGRSECRECPRLGEGIYVGPQVVPDALVMLVGEAPGEKEAETTRGFSETVVDPQTGEETFGRAGALGAREGAPFVGPSGRLLDGLLAKVGLERQAVSVANAVCCWVEGNPTPSGGEIAACAGLLEDTIAKARPKVLVALGGVATARLVGVRAIGKWQGSIVRGEGRVMVGERREVGRVIAQKCEACKGKGVTSTGRGKAKVVVECGGCKGVGAVVEAETFKSGARKGEAKPHREDAFVDQPAGRKVVLTYHPAALLDSGLAEYALVVAALRRAKDLAEGRPLIEVGGAIVPYPQSADVTAILLAGQREIILDVETDGKNGKLTLVGLTPSSDYGVTFLPTADVMDVLRKAFAEPGRTVVGHNVGYDVKTMEREGVPMRAVKLWDTMHAAFYERPELPEILRPKALETVASRLRGVAYRNWKEAYRSGGDASIFQYCASDCAWTAAIRDEMKVRLGSTGRLGHFERNMMPALRTLIDIEQEGVEVDSEKLGELHEAQKKVVMRLREAWSAETGLAPEDRASTPKMRAYFYGRLGLPVQYKGRGKKRVQTLDEGACEVLLRKYPAVQALGLLTAMRHAEKILSTYLEPELGSDGRLHPNYNLSGAITGRLSGDFQQFPRTSERCEGKVDGCVCGRVRETIIADKGDYAYAICDKRQVEFRLWGVVAGDRRIIDIFDRPESDIHQWAADRFGVARKIIKHLVHGGMFLAGAKTVSEKTGMSIEMAYRFLDVLRMEFAVTFQWQAHQVAEARRTGFITTRFGRRVPFKTSDGKIKETEVAAACVQSPAADMLNVDAWRVREAGLKVRHLLHDEVGISARSEADVALLKEVCERPYAELGWMCPVDLGHGRTWADAKGGH